VVRYRPQKNLKEKQLLSYSILRYFIQISLNFKEFNLINNILRILNLTRFEKIKWRLFYYVLPFRLWFYGNSKWIKKRYFK